MAQLKIEVSREMLQRGMRHLQASGRLTSCDDEQDEILVREIIYHAFSPIKPPMTLGDGPSAPWIVLLGMTDGGEPSRLTS